MNRKQMLLVVAIILGVVVSLLSAYPLTNVVLDGNDGGWFTVDNIHEYGDDLDDRAKPGDRVFAGHPSYVAAADHTRLVFDMPRIQYYATTWNGSGAGDEFFATLAAKLRSGNVTYSVHDDMTREILQQNKSVRQVYISNYCRVDDPEAQRLYNETGATLYQFNESCPTAERPPLPDENS